MPSPFSIDAEERLMAIIEMIENTNPDIVTLQEIWLNKYILYLKMRLPEYNFIYANTLFYNQTGLLTLIRIKPIHVQVDYFGRSMKHNLAELLFNKGFISVDIKINNEKWSIFNTHLYASFSKNIETLNKQLVTLFSNLPDANVILCGDLNIDEVQFLEFNQDKFFRLCDSTPTVDIANPYAYAKFNKYFMKDKSKKVDYLLYRNSYTLRNEYEVIKSPVVSDHFPIFTCISF